MPRLALTALTKYRVVMLALGLPVLSSCIMRFNSSDGYNFDRRGEMATQQTSGDVPPEVQRITVENQYGNVQVNVTRERPTWSWDLRCWANTLDAAERFSIQIDMIVQHDGPTSSWKLLLPRPPVPELRGVQSDLTIMVPPSVEVRVANSYGDSSISGVEGGTALECKHGNVKLRSLGGRVDAANSYGNIDAEQLPAGKLVNKHGQITVGETEGNLEVENRYGNIVAATIRGDLIVKNAHGTVDANGVSGKIDVNTSYGRLKLENIDGDANLENAHANVEANRLRGRVVAKNRHGRIELDVDSDEVDCTNEHGRIRLSLRSPTLRSVRAQTSYSDLHVSVLESLTPAVEAETTYGKIRSDVPVFTTKAETDNFANLPEDVARVSLKNKHGDIRVEKTLAALPQS